ncbi:hypothetical protein [Polycyclovorans algicola]|uniref:hypothetical protein n=1 Tax=Polycyclovorans algicola TaxID=616992 RepID=UPI0004A74501|nr:hypothetical protein [Polycyclovorans algicola]
MSTIIKRAALLSPLLAVGLLVGCNDNDTRLLVNPAPTPSVTPTPPPDAAAFEGDAAAFVVFLRDLDTDGDPLPVNDGNIVFQDTSEVTDPVPVNQ